MKSSEKNSPDISHSSYQTLPKTIENNVLTQTNVWGTTVSSVNSNIPLINNVPFLSDANYVLNVSKQDLDLQKVCSNIT